jgi:hypothetical protein
LEEHIASVFRVEEYAEQNTSMKADGSVICFSKMSVNFEFISQKIALFVFTAVRTLNPIKCFCRLGNH